MLAIKIWIFELNFSLLISFLFGVAIGIAIFAIIYLMLVLSTMRDKKYVVLTQVKDVNDEEIKQLIKETQDVFKDKELRGENSNIAYCKELSIELVKNIAIKFFPNSKYPLLELSVDEVIMLTAYISERIDEVLNHRGLKVFRKIKISTILSLGDFKKAIDDNPLVKATKKYKIKEALAAAKNVINVVNPIYWVRKLVVNSVMSIVIKKLCLIIIGIVGEETYKIYSKSVFNKDVSIDSGVDELLGDIKEEIDNTINSEDEISDIKKIKKIK